MYVVNPVEQERKEISDILKELSEYYNHPITDHQVEMYASDLMDMGTELVRRASDAYRRHWESNKFPFPAQLRKAICFTTRDLYVV